MWQDAVDRLHQRMSLTAPGSSVGAVDQVARLSPDAVMDAHVQRSDAIDAVTYLARRLCEQPRPRSARPPRKTAGQKLINKRLIQVRKKVSLGGIDLDALD